MRMDKDGVVIGAGKGALLLRKISINDSDQIDPPLFFSKEDIGLNVEWNTIGKKMEKTLNKTR